MNLKFYKIKSQYLILLPILILSFLLVGCTKEESVEFNDYNHAVFMRNNNIYLYTSGDEYLTMIGDISKVKDAVALNKDNKLLAFTYADLTNEVEIYDITNNSYRQLKLENPDEYYVTGLKWKEDKLAVSLYVDRNTEKTLIYNTSTDELINSCEGIYIDITDDGKDVVYGKSSEGKTDIYIGEDKVYSIERPGEMILDGTINENRIGFTTFYFDMNTGKQQQYVYEGNIKGKELKNIKSIEQPSGITGDIVFTKKNSYMNTTAGTYKIDKDKFILSSNDNEKKSIQDNIDNLKSIFKKTFVSENIDENTSYDNLGIENIIWFSK